MGAAICFARSGHRQCAQAGVTEPGGPDGRLLGQMSGCRVRQNQPSTFSMCMITKAIHAVVIESELYISYVNFKALHAAGNAFMNF